MSDEYTWHDIPRDRGMRERFGMPWEREEVSRLNTLFTLMQGNGRDLLWIAEKMERPVNGIVPKLEKAGLIETRAGQWRAVPSRRSNLRYEVEASFGTTPDASEIFNAGARKFGAVSITSLAAGTLAACCGYPLSFNQEQPVTHPNIETKTFINGRDAAALSDADIFMQIAKLEDEASSLSNIETPSEKLKARIAELRADAVALAKYVDGRTPA